MFNKKTNLNKLSMVIFSINVELQLLKSKMDDVNKSSNNKKIVNELDTISQNLQANIQNLKLMIEYDEDEIELLDVDDEIKTSNSSYNVEETEILDIYKTEVLDDLTREIEILDDGLYKTEILDDLVYKIDSLSNDKEDELDKLKYMENTITLSLKDINSQINSSPIEEVKQINKTLNTELNDVNDKIRKRIKVLKIKKMIWTVLIVIFISIFVVVAVMIGTRAVQNYRVKKEIQNLEQYVSVVENEKEVIEIIEPQDNIYEEYYDQAYNNLSTPNIDGEQKNDSYHKYITTDILSVNFDELLKINSSTVGWIRVENTNVNYPFVQANDNFYYLKHSYNKSSSYMGWIFLDYRNNKNLLDKNTVIYGHGLIDNTMFGSLRNAYDENWYKNTDNQIIKIYTDKGFLLYQLFSLYTIVPEDYYITTSFDSDEEYDKFLSIIKSRSIYDFNVEIGTNDKVLTLSTCYDNNKRAVLHSKLLFKSYED